MSNCNEQLIDERMKDVNAAITLPEKWPEIIQVLSGIRTHDLCVTGATTEYGKTQTILFSAFSPETEETNELARNLICFDL